MQLKFIIFTYVICIFLIHRVIGDRKTGQIIDDGYRAPYGLAAGTEKNFKPPRITEEDELSQFFPSEMLCDACKAVAYQYHFKFLWPFRFGRTKSLSDMEIAEISG